MASEFDDIDDREDDDRPARGSVEPHRGVMILVFGILGLVACGLFGIFAWIFGKRDLDLMRRGLMDREGEQMTKVGYILGIVAMVLMGVSLLLVALFVLLGFGAAASR